MNLGKKLNIKVYIFWEGHKVEEISLFIVLTLHTKYVCVVKNKGEFIQIVVAFLKNLKFKILMPMS